MLLYCNATQIVATHRDDQTVNPALYGAGIQVIPVPDGTASTKVGSPPPTPTTALLLAYVGNAPHRRTARAWM
jgi:hypothetical protein